MTKPLAEWWRLQAEAELDKTLPKVREYSAVDLEIMGAAMLAGPGVRIRRPQGFGIEMAIAFYVLGKVSRAIGAYQEGRQPSDDTWFDIGVYARMAQRVREEGTWPGE